jgi:hypothetical protein
MHDHIWETVGQQVYRGIAKIFMDDEYIAAKPFVMVQKTAQHNQSSGQEVFRCHGRQTHFLCARFVGHSDVPWQI